MSIYTDLKDACIELSSHESDLYAMVTPENKRIIENYKFKCNVRTFINQIDNKLWYDIPFAYDPYWENRGF